jgi:hypothetical protein
VTPDWKMPHQAMPKQMLVRAQPGQPRKAKPA